MCESNNTAVWQMSKKLFLLRIISILVVTKFKNLNLVNENSLFTAKAIAKTNARISLSQYCNLGLIETYSLATKPKIFLQKFKFDSLWFKFLDRAPWLRYTKTKATL